MLQPGTLVANAGAIGRPGQDLSSVVWPTQEVRFVTSQFYYPESGEPRIVVRVVGPELQERPNAIVRAVTRRAAPYCLEVVFERSDVFAIDLFLTKCIIVLASCVVERQQLTRDAFYDRVKQLFYKDAFNGLKKPGDRATTVTREHVVELKDRAIVPRKSF